MGRRPPASRYSENMDKHFESGGDEGLSEHVTAYGDRFDIEFSKIYD